MSLSVIVPCFNAANSIEAQLQALVSQSWQNDWEIVVADNGSTDGTRAIIERYQGASARLRRIDAAARRGAAYARNAGVKAARGELIAFCDADDQVAPGWVAAMAAALAQHEFVASRMDVDRLNPPWLAQRLCNVQGHELRRAFYPPYLKHAGSSGMGVRRRIHEAVGGFDESLGQREDTDYCFRLQLIGVDLVFASDALIHVRYREASKALFRQARQWGYYHALLYKKYSQGSLPSGYWTAYLQTWRALLRGWPKLCCAETRPAWMKALGTQVGLLQGSLRFGIPPVCEPIRAAAIISAVHETKINVGP